MGIQILTQVEQVSTPASNAKVLLNEGDNTRQIPVGNFIAANPGGSTELNSIRIANVDYKIKKVDSIGGSTGAITLGDGLQISNNELSANVPESGQVIQTINITSDQVTEMEDYLRIILTDDQLESLTDSQYDTYDCTIDYEDYSGYHFYFRKGDTYTVGNGWRAPNMQLFAVAYGSRPIICIGNLYIEDKQLEVYQIVTASMSDANTYYAAFNGGLYIDDDNNIGINFANASGPMYVDSNYKLDFKLATDGGLKYNSNRALQADFDKVQSTLVSGTNIKTINSTSLLGSGDITISGEPDAYLKSASASGNTLTLTNKDGSTTTFAPTGTTYTAGNGINIGTDNKISAKLGQGLTLDGTETIVDLDTAKGLQFDSEGGSLQVKVDGSSVSFNSDGQLQASTGPTYSFSGGLIESSGHAVSVNAGDGLQVSSNSLEIYPEPNKGLEVSSDGLAVKVDGSSVSFNSNGQLQAANTTYSFSGGLIESSGHAVSINAGDGLQVASNSLEIYPDPDGGLSVSSDGLAADYTKIQKKLTAGTGITIDSSNVISSTGTTYTFSGGLIESSGHAVSINAGDGLQVSSNSLEVYPDPDGGLSVSSDGLAVDESVIQHKLTAGTGISISGNTISATAYSGVIYKHHVVFTRELDPDHSDDVEIDIFNRTATAYEDITSVISLGLISGAFYSANGFILNSEMSAISILAQSIKKIDSSSTKIFGFNPTSGAMSSITLSTSDWTINDYVESI